MVKGSFEGLYTFLEVAEIYGIDDSCLRKQVARNKFVIGEDVKKMGRTWIITEQAMVRSFGNLKFEEYKSRVAHTVAQKKLEKKEKVVRPRSGSKANSKKLSAKMVKSKGTRSNSKVHSMNEKEEKVKDSWVQGDIKGIELKSFAFNTNDSE
ncbi:MAG: helix-turn-helix domain-containing protein [Clostridium perfringens]|nr:helix-turn-helix domain-containing protein [Clostridium perfringens]